MTRAQLTGLSAAMALLSTVVAAVLVLGAVGSAAEANAKLNSEQLRGLLTNFAHGNGEAAPQNMKAVETNRASALRVTSPGDDVQGDGQDVGGQDVYAMVASGKFTGYRAHIPRGASAPTGDYLSLVVDATTGEVLDWGLTADPPDLTALGGTTDLAP
jgi:hypothetical protein